jgi:hypothetical protein
VLGIKVPAFNARHAIIGERLKGHWGYLALAISMKMKVMPMILAVA